MGEGGTRVKPFERYLKDLLERDASPAMLKVETFEEADLTYKPAGLKITWDDGGCTFIQFLGTVGPGGSKPDRPDYEIPEGRLE
jgi:hypothetical protein